MLHHKNKKINRLALAQVLCYLHLIFQQHQIFILEICHQIGLVWKEEWIKKYLKLPSCKDDPPSLPPKNNDDKKLKLSKTYQ